MRYEQSLDGLRAVSVAGVVAVHIGVPVSGGGNGVEVFFALSGYLITRILLEEESATGTVSLRHFYRNRVLRLAPALLAVLCFTGLYIIARGVDTQERLMSCFYSLFYLMNFNRAFDWGSQIYLGHTWSLSMEEQFYLLWPILMLITPRTLRLRLVTVLIAAICLWRGYLLLNGASVERVYNGFDTHSETLLIGCAAALIEPRMTERAKAVLGRWAPALVLLLIADYLFMPAGTPAGQGIGMIAIGVLAMLLIIALPRSSWPRALFSLAPMTYIGRISYGIYLYHFPILMIGWEIGIPHMRVLTPIVTVAVAAVSYAALEKPFLRLKRKSQVSERGLSSPALDSSATQFCDASVATSESSSGRQ